MTLCECGCGQETTVYRGKSRRFIIGHNPINRILNSVHVCRVCGVKLDDSNWYPSFMKRNACICKMCATRTSMEWRKNNPERHHEIDVKSKRARGINAMNEDRYCSAFLGIHVTEEVLCRVFKNVERMPTNTPGYDFVCSSGYLVDSKSSCMMKNGGIPKWHFHINNNTIADYFILLAFDNRESLTPLYLWMIPGHILNHLTTTSISKSTIDKWDKYRLDINKVVRCCDTIRNEEP